LSAASASRNRCRRRAESRCECCRRQGFSRRHAAADRSSLGPAKEGGGKARQANATLDQARVDLDKTVVEAPIDGAILKVNVRLGEYAQAGVLSKPLMTMRSVDLLHVRVDIYESETWRVRPGCSATARLRGNPEISAPPAFVRFEPYVLPKRSLTGDTTERVDTRVLQAIYEFAPSAFPAFVGQQIDVFIAAPSREAATREPTSGQIAFGTVSASQMQVAGGASRTPPDKNQAAP
jgi:multidrug efflux pump subunit AcrA (membrane-fusion protein)